MSDTFNIMTEVLLVDTEGSWIPTEEVDSSRDQVAYSVGYFSSYDESKGTGFVIKVLEGNDPHAFVLTCAHIFLNINLEFKSEPLSFIVNGDFYDVSIVPKEMCWNTSTNFPIDPISGNKISVPDDWQICEIRKLPREYSGQLVSLKLSQAASFSNGTKVKVYGFPKPISERISSYCAPNSNPSDIEKLNACIHGGKKLILSQGKILSSNDQMICISSPTSKGMSGSPIVIECENGLEVIGVLHGGPAGFLHRKINIAIHANKTEEFVSALKRLLKKIKKQKNFIESSGFREDYDLYKFEWETNFLIQGFENGKKYDLLMCVTSLNSFYRMVLKFEARNGKFVNYNIGMLSESFREKVEKMFS
jgi:hypothetical protein